MTTLACPHMRADTNRGFWATLTLPGVPAFTIAGFVGRLPLAMVALATVLLVSNETGSYAYAGALSALFALTAALVSIATSRWADAVGQTLVLRTLAVAHSVLIVAVTASIVEGLPRILQVVLVIAAGATSPAIGSYVRARWAYIADDANTRRIGFTWESILDEVIFTIGPLLTTFAAFTFGFASPLWLAALFMLVGSVTLSFARRSTPVVHETSDAAMSLLRVVRSRGLRPVILAALGLGLLFGALDVAAVAFTQFMGNGTFAGVVLAAFAGTSMIGGILYGLRPWPGPVYRHAQISAIALLTVLLTLPFVPNSPILALVAGAAGFCVAPTLIGLFTLGSSLVPRRHVTEGLTWTNSGLAAGFASGSALAGLAVDGFGPRAGLGVCVAGACLAVGSLWLRSAEIARSLDAESTHHPATDESASSDRSLLATAWNDDPLPGPHPGG